MEMKENGTNDTNDNEVENCDDKIEGGIPEEVLHEVISSLANQDFYQVYFYNTTPGYTI